MDKELNDVMIAELKRARTAIKNGGGFICLALLEGYVVDGEDGSYEIREAINDLCIYIEDAMQEDCYSTWLMRNHKEYAVAPSIERGIKFKEGRLAWIDAMIAALEKGEELPDTPSLPSDYKGEE